MDVEKEEKVVPDNQLVQKMSSDERKENLTVMRQIRKSDLPDLRMRKDHAGWVEANNDLKRRVERDPWFGVNERLRDAIQLGDTEEKVNYLTSLAAKLGGPPPGITVGSKGYAVHTEIYDIGISPSRASAILEREIRQERSARGRAMMAERKKEYRKGTEAIRGRHAQSGVEGRQRGKRTQRTHHASLDGGDRRGQQKTARARQGVVGKNSGNTGIPNRIHGEGPRRCAGGSEETQTKAIEQIGIIICCQ